MSLTHDPELIGYFTFEHPCVYVRTPSLSSNYYYFLTLGINDPKGGKIKLIKNENSNGHLPSGYRPKNSPATKQRINRCTTTEMRWNKKLVSRLSPDSAEIL